jgi:trehalose 6-phosphate synthase
MNKMNSERLVVVSNRLPLVLSRTFDGELESTPGDGGLVTALMPALRDRQGMWIGWAGLGDADDDRVRTELERLMPTLGYSLEAVALTSIEVEGFYEGFSNGILWPLFHDFVSPTGFESECWHHWQEVNRKFARTVAGASARDGLLWVHDYHLMSVGAQLRRLNTSNRIGFFLHIPFPSPDVFMRLPWRLEILRDLLAYDLVGFQTLHDQRHFIQCLRMLFHLKVTGRGPVKEVRAIEKSGSVSRRLRTGSFPISIDYRDFATRAAAGESDRSTEPELNRIKNGRQLILSVDRLDYTKGILSKLQAFRKTLSRSPDLVERIVFCLQLVPSRESIAEYQQLRLEIERLVSEINGQFSRPGLIPIHYFYGRLERDELVARYRAADVMLVTPFKDGMNLVAKEYCASQCSLDGVLVLSEFAGAAAELQHSALLINPHDIEGIATAIRRAIDMPPIMRARRMKRLQRRIRTNDVFHWVNTYLRALSGRDLDSFPTIDEYVPDAVPSLRRISR